MLITRKSPFSGEENTLDIAITESELAQFNKGEFKWSHRGGLSIQDFLPHISTAHQEFLMTGITPEEWDDLFEKEFD